jgi:membrane protein
VPKGPWAFLRARGLALLVLLVMGALLLASVLLRAALEGWSGRIAERLPGRGIVLGLLDHALNFGLVAALFFACYRLLPDVKLRAGAAWRGALLGAGLFAVARWGLGLYLGHTALLSAWGAAGTLVALLLWIDVSAQALLFGAAVAGACSET